MRDDPGSNSGRREVGGGLQALLGAPMTAYRGCGERDGGLRHGERRSRTGMARVGGDVPFAGGRVSRQRCRQAGNGRARNRARARLNWVSQSQRWGRCRVRRRAEWVSRPAREKNRRRRVLVVTICSPRPMRAVQRARLCAITWIVSQAASAAKQQSCGISVPWVSRRIPAWANSHNDPYANHCECQ